ncbi:MAG: thioredoxin family protein [Hyphomicrobiaceae bacterium]|nr:thioredoxin family protein [Hyphomicrobiaceae bacterium]
MRQAFVSLASVIVVVLALAVTAPGRAAPDFETPARAGAAVELVVLEAPGCIYCSIFRRDVLPAYMASPRAAQMPIRFVDLNDEKAGSLGLSQPVDIVPTFVILRNNEELGRIPGYVGPETFFHGINHILSRR